MKNYDIKSAIAELSGKQKIVVSGKRLAFLVSNMFKRVGLGFALKKSMLEANIAVRQLEKSEKLAEKIAEKEAIKAPLREEVKAEKDAIVAKEAAIIAGQIADKKIAIAQVNQNENINAPIKKYIIKAYKKDIDRLALKQGIVAKMPRRLLISKIFLQKLITNRKNKLIKDDEDKKIEQQLNNLEEVGVEPVVETKASPVVETNTTPVTNEKNSLEEAKKKYLELNALRLKFIEELKLQQVKIKNIQNEMSELVSQNGLRQDMFQEVEEKTK